jgi:hypothetical protein
LCLGLERAFPSRWDCEICCWPHREAKRRNREGEEPLQRHGIVLRREVVSVVIPESFPSELTTSQLFEEHYNSVTHRKCMMLLLSECHPDKFRHSFTSLLDPCVDSLRSKSHQETISRQLYLYLKKGQTGEGTQCLVSALKLLHKYTKIQATLSLVSCKQLCISLARTEPFEACPSFFNEEAVRLFLQNREQEWKRHKQAVLAGGNTYLIVSLVQSFLPEFTKPDWLTHTLRTPATRSSKRRRLEIADALPPWEPRPAAMLHQNNQGDNTDTSGS